MNKSPLRQRDASNNTTLALQVKNITDARLENTSPSADVLQWAVIWNILCLRCVPASSACLFTVLFTVLFIVCVCSSVRLLTVLFMVCVCSSAHLLTVLFIVCVRTVVSAPKHSRNNKKSEIFVKAISLKICVPFLFFSLFFAILDAKQMPDMDAVFDFH